MIKKLLFTSIFGSILLSGDLNGQSLSEAKGTIPDDFLFEKRLHSATVKNNEWSEGYEEDEFAKKARFINNEFLLNGNILFGDTITNYLEEILANLLGPSHSNDIRVYAYRSTAVNAFMTIDGILYVSTGLISQVQNEAELAFVMAHEVIHFEKDHIIEGFKKDQEIERNRTYDNVEKEELETKYSKELELEADELALKDILSKSDYNLENSIEIFDVLLYSYLPFDEKKIDYSQLAPKSIPFPKSVFPTEEKPITAFDDYDDEKSSHPNIKKRKDQYIEILTDLPKSENKKDFVQPEELFYKVQRISQVETITKSILNEDYPRAIYNSLVYLENHPEDSVMVHKNIGFCIHALSGYADEEELADGYLEDIDSFEGELYNAYYFFKNLSSKDLAIISTAYNYNLFTKDTSDHHQKDIFLTSLFELVHYHELKPKDFFIEPFEVVEDTLSAKEVEKLSKLDKIRYKKSLTANTEDFSLYGFIDLLKDTTFVNYFQDEVDHLEELKEEDDFVSLKETREGSGKKSDDEDDFLGIDNLLVLEPTSYNFSVKNRNFIEIEKTYEVRTTLNNSLKTCLEAANVDYKIITTLELDHDDIETYNDYCKLKWWVKERISHVNAPIELSLGNIGEELAEKYGTRYVFVPGIIGLRTKTQSYGLISLASLAVPVTIPLGLYPYFHKHYENLYYAYVFDLKTGNALLVERETFKTNFSPEYLNSILYNSIYQISTEKE